MVKINNIILSLTAIVSVRASEPIYPGDSSHPLAPNESVEPRMFGLSSKNAHKPIADLVPVVAKNPSPESSAPIDIAPVDNKDNSSDITTHIHTDPVDTKDPSPESSISTDAAPEESEIVDENNETTPDIQTPVDSTDKLNNQSSELIPAATGENEYLSAIGDIVKDNAYAIGAATLTAAFATWFLTPSKELS
jgi:hypothetical protein